MTRGARAAAVSGMLVLSLVGCKGGQARGTKTLPPLSPSVGPPTTAPPSPSGTPKRTTQAEQKAEVEAFVRRYFAILDQAAVSGDTSQLLSLSQEGCSCRKAVDAIRLGHDIGSIRGMRHDVGDVTFQRLTKGEAKVVVDVFGSPFEVFDKSGKLYRRRPGVGNAVFAQTLRRVGGDWRVVSQAVASTE